MLVAKGVLLAVRAAGTLVARRRAASTTRLLRCERQETKAAIAGLGVSLAQAGVVVYVAYVEGAVDKAARFSLACCALVTSRSRVPSSCGGQSSPLHVPPATSRDAQRAFVHSERTEKTGSARHGCKAWARAHGHRHGHGHGRVLRRRRRACDRLCARVSSRTRVCVA